MHVQGRLESHECFYNDKVLNRWRLFDMQVAGCKKDVEDDANRFHGNKQASKSYDSLDLPFTTEN